jgi:hypothetical protein
MKELATAPESLFWYWINERHRIYLRRQAGEPKPWTEDPILRDYKFTNVFRNLDRGTIWLQENFLKPHRDDDAGLIVANTAWYRMFNYWGTGERLGWQTQWYPELIKASLRDAMKDGRQVFTNAHIIWSEEGRPKIDAIVDYATNVWNFRESLAEIAAEQNSLESVYYGLTNFRGIGGFQAYEIVTDLRWTRLLEDATDINTWANMGPGAKRGLQRLGLPAKNAREGLESMRYLLTYAGMKSLKPYQGGSLGTREDALEYRVEPHVPTLELRDIEHSLCEFDKYCRVKFGEGEPRMKYNGRA